MAYNKELIAGKLRRWELSLRDYTLPSWEDLPAIDLYMDQVIALLAQYLDIFPREDSDDKVVTVSAINNYVRIKLMPPPYKKKYARIHLAYLILICTLKQSLSIANIRKLIPIGITEEQVRAVYNSYVSLHRAVSLYFIEQVRLAGAQVLDPDDRSPFAVENMVASVAVVSALSRILTEKLVHLQDVQEADVSPPAPRNRA